MQQRLGGAHRVWADRLEVESEHCVLAPRDRCPLPTAVAAALTGNARQRGLHGQAAAAQGGPIGPQQELARPADHRQ